MTEKFVQDGEVTARAHGALRRLTLNRPNALNALTLDMALAMTALLHRWAADEAVGAILIDGAGDRGLCAGGDLRALYDAAKVGDSLPARFWANEYRLDLLIARYPKPVVAVMDGMVMGGGVGLSAHAAHRVVTERSSIAMPETAIGYFPDVGASFLLARAPGKTGTHLALTGERVGAADAIYCGLADIHVPAARIAELSAALADCGTARQVRTRLGEISTQPEAGRLALSRRWIDSCYDADEVEQIIARLRACGSDANAALAAIAKMSPTSLKITLRNIRSALSFGSLAESFLQDYRISLACIAGHDFLEGIRAAIVDKDRRPVWLPDRLDAVTTEMVDRHFAPLGELELSFTD
jgi:enoyl-CoA hydratase/carnithine racemase